MKRVLLALALLLVASPCYAGHREFPRGIRARAVAGKVAKVALTPVRILRGLVGCGGC